MTAKRFTVTVEVVPPAGPDVQPLLARLEPLADLAFDAFSVAANPVAKPRMSALALCALLQQKIGKPAILHCTTRDHNRLSLQGLLWGARALGIEAVLAATGDCVALKDRAATTSVRDVDVCGLVQMAREAGLRTGVVLDACPESNGRRQTVQRLARKVAAGAQFAVTQPVYDPASARQLLETTRQIEIPIILGILPLRTSRHAEFLHAKVAGIGVPQQVRERIRQAADPMAAGVANAAEMLAVARKLFAGACLMPPFDHYEVLPELLENKK